MFLCRKQEVPVESEKLTVLDALFEHLYRSVRERNTGFTRALVDLVFVFLRREKMSFCKTVLDISNRALADVLLITRCRRLIELLYSLC